MGAGDDQLSIGAGDNYLSCDFIRFGDGNDRLIMDDGAGLDIYHDWEGNGGIDFGAGNDQFLVNGKVWGSLGALDFGDGDDTLTIAKGGRLAIGNREMPFGIPFRQQLRQSPWTTSKD